MIRKGRLLECGGCEGRSAPSLYCWYVWIGSLIHSVIAPISGSIPKLQHFRYERRPDHVTTTDFQSALSEDHHRPALRLALSKYPNLKRLS